MLGMDLYGNSACFDAWLDPTCTGEAVTVTRGSPGRWSRCSSFCICDLISASCAAMRASPAGCDEARHSCDQATKATTRGSRPAQRIPARPFWFFFQL